MVHAYILIQTEVGKAAEVASEVGAIDGVVSAEDVTGPYDVIARAESGTAMRPTGWYASCRIRSFSRSRISSRT